MAAPSSVSRPTLPPGLRVMGDYVIERPFADGPFWTTYIAKHAAREGERFEIRVLRTAAVARPGLIEAFAQQVRRIESLRHSGVVPVVATGVDQGVPLVVSR